MDEHTIVWDTNKPFFFCFNVYYKIWIIYLHALKIEGLPEKYIKI